jgi:hypothetical protein
MGHELVSRAFAAISRHFGQLGSYFEHILRIAANFRRIEAGVTVEQLAHLGFSASKGTRQARRRAGSRHFTTRRLTLNQRVRGSSPRGLTSFAPVQPLLPVSPGFPGDRQYGLSWFSRPILPLLLSIETR